MFDHSSVVAWVQKAPFDDIRVQAAQPKFSYEEWFREGKEIPHSVEILAEILASESLNQPSRLGMRVAYALGWIGDRRHAVIAALLRTLNSVDLSLRIESVAALGRLHEPSAQPILEKLLADPKEDLNVRANACISLGRLGNAASEPLLRQAAASTDSFLAACGKEALRLLKEGDTPRKQ